MQKRCYLFCMVVTGLHTTICQVSDMDRSVAFYRDVLELTPGSISPYWSDFTLPDGNRIGLHPPFEDAKPCNGSGWVLGIQVDDLLGLKAILAASGHSLSAFHDVPGGVIANFSDPDGYPIQAIQVGITSKDLS